MATHLMMGPQQQSGILEARDGCSSDPVCWTIRRDSIGASRPPDCYLLYIHGFSAPVGSFSPSESFAGGQIGSATSTD